MIRDCLVGSILLNDENTSNSLEIRRCTLDKVECPRHRSELVCLQSDQPAPDRLLLILKHVQKKGRCTAHWWCMPLSSGHASSDRQPTMHLRKYVMHVRANVAKRALLIRNAFVFSRQLGCAKDIVKTWHRRTLSVRAQFENLKHTVSWTSRQKT